MAATDAAPRVPAWKRIGLKLKYAKDSAGDQTSTPTKNDHAGEHGTASTNFKKRSLDQEVPETPAKRSKSAPAEATYSKPYPRKQAYGQAASDAVPEQSTRSSLPAPTGVFRAPNQTPKRIVFEDDEPPKTGPPVHAQPASLRKSVSFTPDTKVQDGESAHNFFKAWKAEQGVEKNSISDRLAPQPDSPSEKGKKDRKKPKKPKKSKSAKAEGKDSKAEEDSDGTTRNIPDYVEYLQQYHTDNGNWKFNKNKQNDLFRNLFNIYRIPAKHTPAVVQYIKGLKGQARQRIAEQAEGVLEAIWASENEDAEAMSFASAAARRRAYYEALQRSIERYEESGAGRSQYGDQKLMEIAQEHERGKRAEAILLEGLNNELFAERLPAPTPSSTSTPDAAAPANIPRATKVIETAPNGQAISQIQADARRKRKRKARTNASSSSGSSSDSSRSESGSSDSSSAETDSDSGSGDSDSDSDSEPPATRKPSPPKKAKTAPASSPAQTGPLFDSSLLDKKFGKEPTEHHRAAGTRRASDSAHAHAPRDSDSDRD